MSSTESEQNQQPTNGNGDCPRTWTEAPASLNVRARIRGRDAQITLRGESGKEIIEKATALFDWLDKHAPVEPERPPAPTAAAPAVPPPTPGTSIPAVAQQPSESPCAMIEIGTAYQSGAPQLRFYVSGFEKPLTYTKPGQDMLALLAPLGFTADHLQIGARYAVKAFVKHAPHTSPNGKTYHNVLSVRPDATGATT